MGRGADHHPGLLTAVDDMLPSAGFCVGPEEAAIYIKDTVGSMFRFVCTCLCCLFCTGPCLILIGVFMFLSILNDERKDRIEAYNAHLQTWNNGAAIASQDMNIESATGFFSLTATTQSAAHSKLEKNEIINTYTPLFYTGTVAPKAFRDLTAFTTNAIPLTISAGQKPVGGSLTIPAFTEEAQPSRNASQPAPPLRKKINKLCVKISGTAGDYKYDTSNGGPGCFAGELSYPKDGAFYDTCNNCNSISFNPASDATFWATFALTVRHVDDPLLWLNKENVCNTDVSCGDFGASKTDKAKRATMLWIIGGAFCFCTYVPVYAAVMYIKQDSPKNPNKQGGGDGGEEAPPPEDEVAAEE